MMTPDELKQDLTDAGWRISPNTIRRDDVQWYAWLPLTNAGRAELANCTSNEKPPAICIEPHEFDHGSMAHRSVEFIIRGAVGEDGKHWLDLRVYSVPMDECMDTIPAAVKLLGAAWNAAAGTPC
jgi:hypothetical protein